MSLFFPDINVWLALSVGAHTHHTEAWNWLNRISDDSVLIFSRYTQIGILRLLTNQAVMGDQALTVKRAWEVYDRWQRDPRVQFYPEPRSLDGEFRSATTPFGQLPASKWIGDCYLLAYSRGTEAKLVTFDKALVKAAHARGYSAIQPG